MKAKGFADIAILTQYRSLNLKIMSKKVIYAAQAPEPIGPYSQAIQAGNMLFISGQIAIQRSSGNILTST